MKGKLLEIEHLREPSFRLGIQKAGELTLTTINHYNSALKGICPTYNPDARVLYANWETLYGAVAVFFSRNNDLGIFVKNGLLDAAVVGTDTLREAGIKDLAKIRDIGVEKWPFVYAYPVDRQVRLNEARIVATSFPQITKECFESRSRQDMNIVPVSGSVEIMPYLPHALGLIDGITDIKVTGKTMAENGLISQDEPLTVFNPVLIANKNSLNDPLKKEFWLAL